MGAIKDKKMNKIMLSILFFILSPWKTHNYTHFNNFDISLFSNFSVAM
jgi:hypothetical protein